jgi:hypothetical protein
MLRYDKGEFAMSFLDVPPSDQFYSDPEVRNLHGLLSRAYASRESARYLALSAGLTSSLLPTSADNMAQFWWMTLKIAADAGLLRKLVENAAADQGKAAFRPGFDAILQPDGAKSVKHDLVVGETSAPAAQAASWQRQLANYRDSLRLVEERKAEFVFTSEVPLQLVREEAQLRAQIADLEAKLSDP